MKNYILSTALFAMLSFNMFSEDLSTKSKDEIYKGIRSNTAKLTAMKRKFVKEDDKAKEINSKLAELKKEAEKLEKEIETMLMKSEAYKKIHSQKVTYQEALKKLKAK